MLSILVPVYNFRVGPFVSDLHKQASACNIPFEILVYDDASAEVFKVDNRKLEELSKVNYLELPENLGRSKIRNRLTTDAQYDFLLFVDCDSLTISPNYIQNYLEARDPNAVIYGGRVYASAAPEDPDQFLRWHYGVERETIPAHERNATPYRSFLTNNYLIPKAIQSRIRLNEDLVGYGHEDTLLGHDLKEQGIPIRHIDNPLCNIGLESARDFLNKTKQGIQNLVYIIRHGYADEDIRLYQFYIRLKRWGLGSLGRMLFRWKKNTLERNLVSPKPNLRLFDLYKLGCLLEITGKD